MRQTQQNNQLHLPVLPDAVLQCLSPQAGESYLDLTAGYGGHAAAVLERTGAASAAILVDRDAQAVDALSRRFAGSAVTILHRDFETATAAFRATGQQFDMILADLGVSSPHLNQPSRGFSLSQDGPLDMRMDQSQELTAEKLVNSYPEAELAAILSRYGEEPKARAIAWAIVQARPIRTTTELAAVVRHIWRGHSRVHPATRTFQAIRIAVNDELGMLERSLPLWLTLLTPGGRIAIISFHSLEDRVVKQTFKDVSGDRYDASFRLLTKRPITAGPPEIVSNPRARSAKLRAAAKTKK